MKRARIMLRTAIGAAVLAIGIGGAASAQAPSLKALNGLEAGRWVLHARDGSGDHSVCLPDAGALIQVAHRGGQCSRFVIEDGPRSVTVHYTCPRRGHGRTTITVETPRSARVATQGVADGAPFQHDYHARKVGACRARPPR